MPAAMKNIVHRSLSFVSTAIGAELLGLIPLWQLNLQRNLSRRETRKPVAEEVDRVIPNPRLCCHSSSTTSASIVSGEVLPKIKNLLHRVWSSLRRHELGFSVFLRMEVLGGCAKEMTAMGGASRLLVHDEDGDFGC
ncbi:uncharacterized protein HKW66_Vig0185550 [Vigna angularis]|uniref:Uncharacterized protein n=1 Tax=Phaseolus angularis TaxID=3914 RepID=A0A8T0KWA6_PHAAN|nr:uncharacterized protein HKW66_Vig0185550 [Vigna angularis]